MEKIELVIFDMDGLMIDSETVYIRCADKLLKKMGYYPDRSFFIDTIGIDWKITEKMYYEVCPGIDYEDFTKKLDIEMKEYLREHPYKKKKGLMKLLKYLKKNNIAMAVATSTHKETANRRLNSAGIKEYFDYIVYGDDISEGKPSPQIYLTVLNKMNVKAENALVLEDSKNGLISASDAGINCIIIPDICIIPDEILVRAYAVKEDLGCVIDVIEDSLK